MADWPCAEANRARRKPKYVDSNDEDEDYEESATGETLVLDDQAVRVIIGIEQQPTDQNQPAQQTDFKDPMDGDRGTCGKKRCADRYDSSESSDRWGAASTDFFFSSFSIRVSNYCFVTKVLTRFLFCTWLFVDLFTFF